MWNMRVLKPIYGPNSASGRYQSSDVVQVFGEYDVTSRKHVVRAVLRRPVTIDAEVKSTVRQPTDLEYTGSPPAVPDPATWVATFPLDFKLGSDWREGDVQDIPLAPTTAQTCPISGHAWATEVTIVSGAERSKPKPGTVKFTCSRC